MALVWLMAWKQNSRGISSCVLIASYVRQSGVRRRVASCGVVVRAAACAERRTTATTAWRHQRRVWQTTARRLACTVSRQKQARIDVARRLGISTASVCAARRGIVSCRAWRLAAWLRHRGSIWSRNEPRTASANVRIALNLSCAPHRGCAPSRGPRRTLLSCLVVETNIAYAERTHCCRETARSSCLKLRRGVAASRAVGSLSRALAKTARGVNGVARGMTRRGVRSMKCVSCVCCDGSAAARHSRDMRRPRW